MVKLVDPNKPGILTEHLIDPEDAKLDEQVRENDSRYAGRLLLYICLGVIYYGIIHLIFPSHWPVYAMIATLLGVLALSVDSGFSADQSDRNSSRESILNLDAGLLHLIGWALIIWSVVSTYLNVAKG